MMILLLSRREEDILTVDEDVRLHVAQVSLIDAGQCEGLQMML
jgi:sRNA-binding carbon storage regulator CsrA